MICEISLTSYGFTNFSTYVEYCKQMSISLMEGKISKRERQHIEKIIEGLDKVFSLTQEETGIVIADYFSLSKDRILAFEKAIRMTKEFFPIIGD